MKHLVLLGGGAQHLQVLRELAASPLPGTEVTLIAPAARHVHRPLLPAWVAGECALDDITVPLAPWAQKAGVALVEAELVSIDPALRELTLSNGYVVSYDALSVDADAVADREAIPGARENALFIRPVEHFIRLWGALVTLSEQQTLSLVVVGGEAPAVEMALAIQKRLARRARVALVTGGGSPLAGQPEAFQLRVKQALKRGQVTLFEDRCDALSGRQMQLGQGMRLACDAPVLAQDPTPPLWLFNSGLSLDHQGFLKTGATLQSESHPEVFAVGELAVRTDRPAQASTWYPLSKTAPSSVLTLNLRRFLAGGPLAPDPNKPVRGLQLLGTGEGMALARVGRFVGEGRWAGWLKAKADRAWLQGFAVGMQPLLLPGGDTPAAPLTPAEDKNAP